MPKTIAQHEGLGKHCANDVIRRCRLPGKPANAYSGHFGVYRTTTTTNSGVDANFQYSVNPNDRYKGPGYPD